MRSALCFVLAILSFTVGADGLLHAQSVSGVVQIGTPAFSLSVSRQNGAILAASTICDDKSVRLFGENRPPVDICVNGRWLLSDSRPSRLPTNAFLNERPPAWHVVDVQTVKTEEANRVSIKAVYRDWSVALTYRLDTAEKLLVANASWTYQGEEPVEVQAVRFRTASGRIGEAADCLFTMPTFWPPKDIPLAELAEGQRHHARSTESTPAAAILHNPTLGLGLCTSMFSDQEYLTIAAEKRGDAVDISADLGTRGTLRTGDSIDIGGYAIAVVRGSLRDTLRATGRCWRAGGFTLPTRPAWTAGAAAYSLWVGGSVDSDLTDVGGLCKFQEYLLPRLNRLGIDIVWLNPINRGSYGSTEHRAIDPRLGTIDDLRNLCIDAHARNMRVWLDLIPHGPREHSPDGKNILAHHPEWVSRDGDGNRKHWWGGLCCDYANPGWQAEMADVATYYVKHADIDGWRVDCAQGSPPNERPLPGLRPSQSGVYGALRLLGKVRNELQAAKPEAALLGETGSACHLTQCDFIYDWCTQRAVYSRLPAMPLDMWVPHLKVWLERQQTALPAAAVFGLMRFLENHDQYRSVRRFGVGEERALLSLCALIPGLPFIFNEQDVGFGYHLASLFKIIQDEDAFRHGAAYYGAVTCSAPKVLTFARTGSEAVAVVAINFSGKEESVRITVADTVAPNGFAAATPVTGTELYTQTHLGTRSWSDWRTLDLVLPAYAARILRLTPARPGETATPVPPPQTTVPKVTPATVITTGDQVVVTHPTYRITLDNGLIAELTPAGEARPVLSGMDIVEGTRKAWPGPRLEWKNVPKVVPQVESDNGTLTVRYEGTFDRGPATQVAWNAQYAFHPDGKIETEVQLVPPPFDRPVRARLGLDIRFSGASRYRVNTIEGVLEDACEFLHPSGDMVVGHRYWHRSGLPWESTLHPLDLQCPVIAFRGEREWVEVEVKRAGSNLENVYLRERSATGENVAALHLGWLDEKSTANLAKPLRATLVLRVRNAAPEPSAGMVTAGPIMIRCEGSHYTCRTPGYEMAFCRGLGGSMVHFSEPDGKPLITSSEIYSDRGIYAPRNNSTGNEVNTLGASRFDFEPDLLLTRGPSGKTLSATLASYLRLSYWNWANVATPRVQYRVRYDLSDSHVLKTECHVRPMLSDRDFSAFLAQRFSIADVASWRVEAQGGELTGNFTTGSGTGRVWQSVNHPLHGAISITAKDGRILRFSNLTGSADDAQNVFLLDSGHNSAVLFLAFFDGNQTRYTAAWRRLGYSLEVLQP